MGHFLKRQQLPHSGRLYYEDMVAGSDYLHSIISSNTSFGKKPPAVYSEQLSFYGLLEIKNFRM